MTRILILIVLAFILYQIIKRVIANAKAHDLTKNSEQNADKNPDKKPDEKMLQCTQCGCHVPESHAKIVNEKIICNSPECNKIAHGDWFICQIR